MGFAGKFWKALKQGDVEQAMQEMRSYMAGIPYVEGFKQKLQDASSAEGFYEYTMYLIFSMLNVYARTQVKCAGGRTDMVVWMADAMLHPSFHQLITVFCHGLTRIFTDKISLCLLPRIDTDSHGQYMSLCSCVPLVASVSFVAERFCL